MRKIRPLSRLLPSILLSLTGRFVEEAARGDHYSTASWNPCPSVLLNSRRCHHSRHAREHSFPKQGHQQREPGSRGKGAYQDQDKLTQICFSNVSAAKAVADAIRTSLGPKGMDNIIQDGKGDVTITNNSVTILKQTQVLHPAARMLVELSKAQDIEAGGWHYVGCHHCWLSFRLLYQTSVEKYTSNHHFRVIPESFGKGS